MTFKRTLFLEFTDFQYFPGPPFPVLENVQPKLWNFLGFLGPMRTLGGATLLKVTVHMYVHFVSFLN